MMMLDNIRTEIEQMTPTYHNDDWFIRDLVPISKVIKIIDKYRESVDMGEVSDGYHTFNQLYYQRAVLFATIVNLNKDKAWKSFKHSDGNYCFDKNGEWFIVGVDTPKGSYTYHYSKEYWDMFDCEELECGKEWDGHTEVDVTRLLSLEQEPKTGHWILYDHGLDAKSYQCSVCKGFDRGEKGKYCKWCGAKNEG